MSISIGSVRLRNRVLLAPMSGVSDAPFREVAHAYGAGLVVSEMVASRDLAAWRSDVVRRALGRGRIRPHVIQLAGREAYWMSEGARFAQDLGADILDINMGCPARQVTGGLSGSALMRDLDHAMRLIEATVAASRVPVTLKMRLGWDETSMIAPELAQRAENAGIQMVTVHGRTRCQFYKGRADWTAIRRVKERVRIPVVANGDCADKATASAMLETSDADAIMVGRGAYGRPWWPGALAEALDPGTGRAAPTLSGEATLALIHHDRVLEVYGHEQGNRVARKHLGWIIDRKLESGLISTGRAHFWRDRLMKEADNRKVTAGISDFFRELEPRFAEAA
ncbi:MAG: tRNA dihydrouridine synthase DusB [Hyphomicrobiales bacterium]